MDCRHWRIALIALPLLLAGCASNGCDEPGSDDACRDAQLLYQNDMLQAKLLIISGEMDNHALANALLKRAAEHDERGEAAFYQAILKVREGPQAEEVLTLLEKAADQKQPYAIAMLYKIYTEPYLIDEADPEKAQRYRGDYAELDVAKSGYPSFEKALELVNALATGPVPPPPAP